MQDHYSFWNHHIAQLGFGVILLFVASVSTCTGKTYFRGTIVRSESTSEYWFVVIAYYLGAILFIGSFFVA